MTDEVKFQIEGRQAGTSNSWESLEEAVTLEEAKFLMGRYEELDRKMDNKIYIYRIVKITRAVIDL